MPLVTLHEAFFGHVQGFTEWLQVFWFGDPSIPAGHTRVIVVGMIAVLIFVFDTRTLLKK
jgi:hypothetical protein